MQIIKLSFDDIEYLKNKYPKLVYYEQLNLIKGEIEFKLIYEKLGVEIEDSYMIEIDLNESLDGLPKVRETQGKILNMVNEKEVYYGDFHLNDLKGEMCMIIPPKIKERYPNGFDLKKLLYHIEEHLYWVSYYNKYDKKPWKDYNHGHEGYIDLYIKEGEKYKDEIMKHLKIDEKTLEKLKYLRSKNE